ncbi:MAG: FAD-binding oxidoreductase [Nanoarchaeota archaeon]|nr:FAD-binding oxidoreductase [Nanoarchaeota archaeon]
MKLADIFPKNRMSLNEIDKTIYARDASEYEGICKAVVWPKTAEEVHQLVHYARRANDRLTIRGAGTSSFGGCVPADSIVVDMSKMNKIIEVGKDYVIVESGMVVDDLNKELKKVKKFFPVLPLESEVCTIGGMLATNCLGLETYYGKMQDWILEIKVVDGTAKVLDLSPVPARSFIGTEGVMGIVCRVKLKVLTKPMMKTVSIFKFNTLRVLLEKIKELENDENVLEMYYLDEFCSNLLELGGEMHLIVELKDESGLIKNKDEINSLNEMKKTLQHLLVNKRYGQKEDVKIPMEAMSKFLFWLRKNNVPSFGYLKLGIVHPCFRDYSNLPKEMYQIVKRLEGELKGDYPMGIKKKELIPKKVQEQLDILKNQFDPARIFNRGVLID